MSHNRPSHSMVSRVAPLLLAAVLAGALSAHGATITVTSNADNTNVDGQVTLREAIQAAETDTSVDNSAAGSGADTIVFAPALAGQTITLSTTGDFSGGPSAFKISSNLTIDGAAAPLVVISGANARRIFLIMGTGSLTLKNVTLSGGRAMGGTGGTDTQLGDRSGGGGGGGGLGGAIFVANGGTLNISQSTLTASLAQGGAGGAGVVGSGFGTGGGGASAGFDGGNVTVSSNIGGGGGGVQGPGANASAVNTGGNGGQNELGAQASGGTVATDGANGTLGGGGGGSGGKRAGNGLATSSSGFGGGGGGGSAQGGAPFAAGGDGGFGAGGGGAFGNGILGTNPGGLGGFGGGGGGVGGDGANIGNGAGAGGFGGGAGVSGGGGGAGLGGAIFNNGGNVTLTNSTITGNSAIGGAGGAAGGGTAGNSGQGLGGGIFNRNGNCTILNCTIDANTAAAGGGGIYSLGDGAGNTATLTMNNTICADSSTGADAVAFANAGGASNASGSNNVITSTAIATFTGTITASPQVSALASNGGPTQTMAIGAASPAVNAANNSLAPATDQRSFARPDTADIGAFEFNGALTITPPATPPTITSAPSATPNPALLSQTVQFSAAGSGSGTLTFIWDFGDGSSASGANVSHQFSVPGTYTVTVILTDASGQTASQNVSVTITPTRFRVRRAQFTLSAGADSASITGLIHVPSGINLSQQKITTIVGGNVQEFTFSSGRRAVSGANTMTLNARTRGGVTVDQEATFKLKLSGSLGTAFKANAPLDANGFPTQIFVQVQFNGIYYGVTLQTSFKSGNKGAKAKTKTQ